MKLRFTRRATADLAAIADYLAAESPGASRRVRDAILEACRLASRFPDIGRRQSVSGVRRLVTRRYAYSIYYLPDHDAGVVAILSIQHPRREQGL